MNEIQKTCPHCGTPIPASAPQGLCPKCLLLGAATPSHGGALPPSRPHVAPPSLSDLAKAFPQLEILNFIGQGGMGFVYRARQPKLDRMVALKILPHSLATDPAFTERFAREGRLLARLSHPNIIAIHDFGEVESFYYLLMEFVDGVNLREAMQSARFTPTQALQVVVEICNALQFAHHQGVLHRDIKPENILIDSQGRVKIADFGIAKLLGDTQPDPGLTADLAALGTPNYMAPEQRERPAEVDHRADIYSLGVVFYELLTGELPLGHFAPPSRKSEVDARIDAIVLRALARERELRQQSAGEVKTQVEEVRSHPASSPSPPPPPASVTTTPPPPWQITCLKCGHTRTYADVGGYRYGAASYGKVKLAHCPRCEGLRFCSVHRRSAPYTPEQLRAHRHTLLGLWSLFFIGLGLALYLGTLILGAYLGQSGKDHVTPNTFFQNWLLLAVPGGLLPLLVGMVLAFFWFRHRRSLPTHQTQVVATRKGPSSHNPWPRRIFWLIILLVVVPILLLAVGLILPIFLKRAADRSGFHPHGPRPALVSPADSNSLPGTPPASASGAISNMPPQRTGTPERP